MKITNYTKSKLKPGVTLIELTVVIVVILSLIAVLFIGAQAYRNGASRSACVVLLRSTHQAVRSHQNLNGGFAGGPVIGGGTIQNAIVGTTTGPANNAFFSTVPVCPRDGLTYVGLTSSTYPMPNMVDVNCVTFGTNGVTPDGHVFNENGATGTGTGTGAGGGGAAGGP